MFARTTKSEPGPSMIPPGTADRDARQPPADLVAWLGGEVGQISPVRSSRINETSSSASAGGRSVQRAPPQNPGETARRPGTPYHCSGAGGPAASRRQCSTRALPRSGRQDIPRARPGHSPAKMPFEAGRGPTGRPGRRRPGMDQPPGSQPGTGAQTVRRRVQRTRSPCDDVIPSSPRMLSSKGAVPTALASAAPPRFRAEPARPAGNGSPPAGQLGDEAVGGVDGRGGPR